MSYCPPLAALRVDAPRKGRIAYAAYRSEPLIALGGGAVVFGGVITVVLFAAAALGGPPWWAPVVTLAFVSVVVAALAIVTEVAAAWTAPPTSAVVAAHRAFHTLPADLRGDALPLVRRVYAITSGPDWPGAQAALMRRVKALERLAAEHAATEAALAAHHDADRGEDDVTTARALADALAEVRRDIESR